MSGKLSEVEARIGTVHQLEAVITAMRGSAAARSHEARSRLDGIRAYAAAVGKAIGQALALAAEADPQPTKPHCPERHVVIVLSSEQGFAGTFNERVFDLAERHPKTDGSEFLMVGDRGAIAAERGLVFGWSAPMVSHADEVPVLASRITDALYQRLEKDQASQVTVIHAMPAPSATIEFVERSLLPFDFARFKVALRPMPPITTLPPEQLLAELAEEYVEEGNLKFQVGALRRALGDGRAGRRYIATSAGQGYRFVAPVSVAQAPAAAPLPAGPTRQNHNLPQQLTRLIGRADAVSRIVARLQRHHLLSIVGPGGIGKTSVAIAVAEASLNTYEHGVWFVDLAPLADARLVPSAVAQVLGLDIRSGDPVPGLAGALRERRLLMVLDNCEHVIEAAATLAVAILKGAAGVHILATSREPLRVEAEHVQRLPPLASGFPSDRFDAAEALAFPAVELFVERAAECLGEFELTDENAAIVAEICRKLDGIPLAIELAAARVESFGVRGLAARLDDRIRLLTSGRRSGPPRHRTLRAALDWSYEVLSEPERAVLRRLGIFVGGFTLDAACAVVADPKLLKGDVVDAVAELTEKSLAVVETAETEPRLRLLETTRAYALERLAETGEREEVAHRHAEYYRNLCERVEGETATRPRAEWLADSAREIDKVRAALDWSLSSPAHKAIGMELTATYVPLWMNLSLAAECRERCEHALHRLETDQISNAQLRMRLQIGLGNSLLHTLGPSEQAQTILTEALTIADTLGDLHAQLRVLLVLSSVNVYRGEYARGAAEVERAAEIAHRIGDVPSVVVAERRMGTTLLTIGKLSEAQRWYERVIRSPPHLEEGQLPVWRHSGDRAMARAMLARALWLQGFPDRAHREAQASIDDVRGPDHQLTMYRVLYFGIGRIAPMTGEFSAAENAVATLIELATRINAPFWITAGQFLRGKLFVQRQAYAEGLAVLRDAFEICRQTGWRLSYPEFTGSLALALAGLGRFDEAYDAVAGAIESAGGRADGQQWYVPELLRIKGEILLQHGSERALAAASCLDQATAMAREQGALSWELRIGLSLCRLRVTQGRGDEGRRELASIYERFTEGFDTADLREAKRLIDALS